LRRPCIVILGSGAAMPSHERFTSTLLLLALRSSVMLDVGEGAQIRLSRIGFSVTKINLVAITHLHGDHFLGLYPLLQSRALSMHGSGQFTNHQRLIVVSPEKTLCETLANIPWIECRVAEHGAIISLNDCALTPLRMSHGDIPSFGYLVEVFLDRNRRRSVKVFYGGDGVCTPDTIEYLKRSRVDVMILDSSFSALDVDKAIASNHSTATQAALTARDVGARILVLTHVSARYSEADRESLISEARRFYSGMVIEARDFMVLPLWILNY